MYDYSARYMDPAIGRFTTVDPLAEKYYSISPYEYPNGQSDRNDIDCFLYTHLLSGCVSDSVAHISCCLHSLLPSAVSKNLC